MVFKHFVARRQKVRSVEGANKLLCFSKSGRKFGAKMSVRVLMTNNSFVSPAKRKLTVFSSFLFISLSLFYLTPLVQ